MDLLKLIENKEIENAKDIYINSIKIKNKKKDDEVIEDNFEKIRERIRVGDTVKIDFKLSEEVTKEGKVTIRSQIYEGVIIAINNSSIRKSITVRKISHGVGVERVFPLYSPKILNLEIVKRAVIRRAKLYYLRGRSGKSAKLKDDIKATIKIKRLEAFE